MGKFPFNNLPSDLQILILSNLSFSEFKNITGVISYNIIHDAIKYKYKIIETEKIRGLINNLNYNCFICKKFLFSHYNLVLCTNCYINYNYDIHYPEICHKCCILKLSRGEVRVSRCPVCQQYSTQLGITSFS